MHNVILKCINIWNKKKLDQKLTKQSKKNCKKNEIKNLGIFVNKININ